MKNLAIVFFIVLSVFATDIRPKVSIKTSSPVIDMVFRGTTLWGVNAQGEILAYDANGKGGKKGTLPTKLDYYGTKTLQKGLTLDVSPSGRVAIGAEEGALYILANGKMVKTTFTTPSIIRKVGFITENLVLIALVSNEAILFDTSANRILYRVQINTSTFNDFALSADKSQAFFVGEAGVVTLLNTRLGKITGIFKGGNVDNIFKVDSQHGYVFTAGQDRRAILYTPNGKIAARFDANFLIYGCALSPNLKTAVFSINDANDLALVDVATKQIFGIAKGHNATLNRIVFLNDKRFASCADENKILLWERP